MNKKVIIILVLAITILVGSGIIFATLQEESAASLAATSDSIHNNSSNNNNDGDDTDIPPDTTDEEVTNAPSVTEAPFVPATEMDLDPTSITVFVNREFALPKDYEPEGMVTPDIYFNLVYYDDRTLMRKEAATAIEDLFAAAKKDGCSLSGVSGYRSYQRQKKIFTNNIITKGKTHTLKYSAVPGTSEHQTGLVMDISCASLGYDLNDNFIDTPEGQWVAKNAYRFGFIVRYPDGKAAITGYSYEPWHIRYVGKALAKYLYENDLTLDEYYNYTPSPDFDFEAVYASLINYKPPVRPTAPPITGEDILDENGEIIDGEAGNELPPDGTVPDGTNPDKTPTDNPKGNHGTKTPTPSPKPTQAVEEPVDDPADSEEPVTTTPDPGDAEDNGSTDTEEGSASATPTPDPGLTGTPIQ